MRSANSNSSSLRRQPALAPKAARRPLHGNLLRGCSLSLCEILNHATASLPPDHWTKDPGNLIAGIMARLALARPIAAAEPDAPRQAHQLSLETLEFRATGKPLVCGPEINSPKALRSGCKCALWHDVRLTQSCRQHNSEAMPLLGFFTEKQARQPLWHAAHRVRQRHVMRLKGVGSALNRFEGYPTLLVNQRNGFCVYRLASWEPDPLALRCSCGTTGTRRRTQKAGISGGGDAEAIR